LRRDHDKEDCPPSGSDKTFIVFSLRHKPGALYDSLREFATTDINLAKLESRPPRHQPWEYNFYMDGAGHREEREIGEALKALGKLHCTPGLRTEATTKARTRID
jgi:chorismate mutase/prephenate dehydratase